MLSVKDMNGLQVRTPSLCSGCKHQPLVDEDLGQDESEKLPIHFDALGQPGYGDRRSQKAIHLGVLEALGITKKNAGITERFARRFFAELP